MEEAKQSSFSNNVVDLDVWLAGDEIHGSWNGIVAPIIRPIISEKGAEVWELYTDWPVKLRGRRFMIVPKRSQTNFASIPRLLRGVISKTDPVVAIPAIAHDALVGEFGDKSIYGVVYDLDTCTPLPKEQQPGWAEAAKDFKYLITQYKGWRAVVKGNIAYGAVRLWGFVNKAASWFKGDHK